MPCYSPSFDREKESAKVSRLIIYVNDKLGIITPQRFIDNANFDYTDIANEATEMLCGIIRDMSDEDKERIVYNAHSKKSRKLADWWEDHYEFDLKEGWR